MEQSIRQRIDSLRAFMADHKLGAFIIPSSDPHQSEYVAPYWETRKWLSGFTGSAGTLVVTTHEAGLWTDSRYFLQAAEQLEGSGIDLYKDGLPETPDIASFLKSRMPMEAVGIDGSVFSASAALQLKKRLEGDAEVRCFDNPWEPLWPDRPPMPQSDIIIYPLQYAGTSCADKLAAIRQTMQQNGADRLLVSSLDEIAWTLNIRANDVHCNPVAVSYLIVERDAAHFFVAPQRVGNELGAYLAENGVSVHPYDAVSAFLSNGDRKQVLQTELGKTNFALYLAACQGATVTDRPSPVAPLKAVRNATEQAGIRNAMQRDGVALVRFLKWLEEAVPTGKETELSIDRKLHECRAAQPLYMGESFDTIAGYGAHGAIVHYEATPETDVPLRPEGFLLLDSGAQYLDGTTDITRTIALGPLTDEEKTDYTLILKGHIDLAMAVFPEGTRGAQLDVLARMPIWKRHMNFLHGTGHGVGHFLNVHEGPQSIRMNENPVPLQAGMVTSNEPGVYKAGSHGIRTENLVLTIPAGEGMFGCYLKFETLTLCPICTKGIVKELLTQEETDWLNNYHRTVYEKLSPSLNKDEQQWLAEACKAI